MTDDLKAQVQIPSKKLTSPENSNGTNMAYWSIKYAYHKMSKVQEQLRAEKNYASADAIRDVKDQLRQAYEYRFVSHSISKITEGEK